MKLTKKLRLQLGNAGFSTGGGLGRSSQFSGGAKSYRRTETVGSVDEHVYNVVYELSVRSSGHAPHRWWIDRPGDVVARVVVPHQHVPAQPLTGRAVGEAGRVVPLDTLPETAAGFRRGGVAGVFPAFLTSRDLPLAAARLYQQAGELPESWLEDWGNWPAELTRAFSSTDLAAHFAELTGPGGLAVDLPDHDGWHHMLRVRMVVTEPRHLTAHAAEGEEVEIEQYSQGQAQYRTGTAKERSHALSVGAGLRFDLGAEKDEAQDGATGDDKGGEKESSRHIKLAGLGKARWEWGRSAEETLGTGPVGITRATYGGVSHTYRADPVFELTVHRWKNRRVLDLLVGPRHSSVSRTEVVRVTDGLEFLVPEQRIPDLGLPLPPDVEVAPWHEPTGHVEPALLPGASHAEALHADGVLESMTRWLAERGLVKDHGAGHRPGLLLRELERSFSSEALLSQYSVLTGGGVSRWLAVPTAFGARYLWVHVTADAGPPREQRDRPEVRLTLRNQAMRATGRSTATSFGWQAAVEGRARFGKKIHVGPEIEAGYGRATERGHEKSEKEMEIYRAQTREGSVEFGHDLTFRVRMGLALELPDVLRAPWPLFAAPRRRPAGRAGNARSWRRGGGPTGRSSSASRSRRTPTPAPSAATCVSWSRAIWSSPVSFRPLGPARTAPTRCGSRPSAGGRPPPPRPPPCWSGCWRTAIRGPCPRPPRCTGGRRWPRPQPGHSSGTSGPRPRRPTTCPVRTPWPAWRTRITRARTCCGRASRSC